MLIAPFFSSPDFGVAVVESTMHTVSFPTSRVVILLLFCLRTVTLWKVTQLTGVQPGRTEELTLPQGQLSSMGDGNWWPNTLFWRDKFNTYSDWFLSGIEP